MEATDSTGDMRSASIHFTLNNVPVVSFTLDPDAEVGVETTATARIADADSDTLVAQALTVTDADGGEAGSTTAFLQESPGTYSMEVNSSRPRRASSRSILRPMTGSMPSALTTP